MIFSNKAVGTIFNDFFIGFFRVLVKFFRAENQRFRASDKKQLKKMLDSFIYLLPLHQQQHNKPTTHENLQHSDGQHHERAGAYCLGEYDV